MGDEKNGVKRTFAEHSLLTKLKLFLSIFINFLYFLKKIEINLQVLLELHKTIVFNKLKLKMGNKQAQNKKAQFIDIAKKYSDIEKKIKDPHECILQMEMFLENNPILNELSNICERGDLEEAEKFLLENPTIIDTRHFEDAFVNACVNGHLEIAKMLRKIKPTVDISKDDEVIFRDVCGDGDFEVAKWLLEVKPDINISIYNDQPFSYACLSGNLELAEFLLEKKKTIDISVYNRTFSWVCTTTGNIEVARWLMNKCPSINIWGDINDINFKNACKFGYSELAEWLIWKH